MNDMVSVLYAIFQVIAQIGRQIDSLAKRIDGLTKSLS